MYNPQSHLAAAVLFVVRAPGLALTGQRHRWRGLDRDELRWRLQIEWNPCQPYSHFHQPGDLDVREAVVEVVEAVAAAGAVQV